MSGVEDALARITADLSSTDVNFALIGGLAVSVRTTPRFTQDVDLAVAVPDDAAAEQTVKALMDRSYGLMATVEHDTAGRLATARLRLPASGQIVDLLFSSSGIEPEIVAAADMIYVAAGLRLPVAQVGHLLALKLLARDDERPATAHRRPTAPAGGRRQPGAAARPGGDRAHHRARLRPGARPRRRARRPSAVGLGVVGRGRRRRCPRGVRPR